MPNLTLSQSLRNLIRCHVAKKKIVVQRVTDGGVIAIDRDVEGEQVPAS